MKKLRALPALALVLALSLTSACSGRGIIGRGGSDPGPSSGQVAIVIQNNLVPSSSVTIHVIGPQGSRQLLGTVPPGTTRTIRFRAGVLLERYRFVASLGFNREITSNPLPLSGGETVRWQLNTNSAFID